MLDTVSWFNNHSGASALLKRQQLQEYKKLLALLRPGSTRWTGTFVAADRFLESEKAIRILLITSWDELIAAGGKERDQIQKSTSLLSQLRTDSFWMLLKECVRFLNDIYSDTHNDDI